MIVKMKYVNIAGPVKQIDRVIADYITKSDIQLDYATRELSDTDSVTAFTDQNPYTALLTETAFIRGALPPLAQEPERSDMSTEEASDLITRTAQAYRQTKADIAAADKEIAELETLKTNISHFAALDFRLEDLSAFTHIDYRFGYMPRAGFMQFEAYIYEDSKVIIEVAHDAGEYVWCVYFAPHGAIKKEDVIFASLHFHTFEFPKELDGEPIKGSVKDVLTRLEAKLAALNERKNALLSAAATVDVPPERLAAACGCIETLAHNFDYRKYAGLTGYDYFVFVGWMPEKKAWKLLEKIEAEDEGIAIVLEDDNESIKSAPPTRLKNLGLFRPFEYLVRMYGVPCYNEIDPTPFVALTYSVFFGMMFGDIGQGALLSLIGLYLFKKKGSPLGGILSIVGLFSVLFGFMYGSVFGFEDLLPALWLRPSHDIMSLVIVAVSMGGGTLLVCMALNIINAAKSKDKGRLLFDQNGVAGAVFYIGIIGYAVARLVLGVDIPNAAAAAVIGIPLIIIAFKEPLSLAIDKTRERHEIKSKAMFVFTCLMELVEVILSFFTNTLSFVRIAGYAISHAGLMSVVMILSGYTASAGSDGGGGVNVLVIIIGNLFVMGLEGLIVFIQAMRLQYYEMFSRYYKGGGNEFAVT